MKAIQQKCSLHHLDVRLETPTSTSATPLVICGVSEMKLAICRTGWEVGIQICRKICGLGCVTRALVHAWFTQPSPRIFLHFCIYSLSVGSGYFFPLDVGTWQDTSIVSTARNNRERTKKANDFVIYYSHRDQQGSPPSNSGLHRTKNRTTIFLYRTAGMSSPVGSPLFPYQRARTSLGSIGSKAKIRFRLNENWEVTAVHMYNEWLLLKFNM